MIAPDGYDIPTRALNPAACMAIPRVGGDEETRQVRCTGPSEGALAFLDLLPWKLPLHRNYVVPPACSWN